MKSSNKSLVKIAKIIEAKGLKGEVKVLFFSGDSSLIDDLDFVFFNNKKYEIQSVSNTSKSDRVGVKFKEINDRTAAEKLKGAEIFIEEDLLESSLGEEIFLREILGFEVFDKDLSVGKISGFESNQAQDLLVVKNDAKTYLIPLVKEFIIKIDFENKKILMTLPEGLLEVF